MRLRRLNIVPLVMLFVWIGIGSHYPQLEWWGYGIILLLQLAILVYGCVNIQSGYFMPVLCNANTNEKVVALTFDDGPNPTLTPRILETLANHNVQATFFVIGRNIDGNEALVSGIFDNHLVGNHSFSHAFWFDMYGSKKMLADMAQADEKIKSITGVKPLLFRPPYGVMNPNLKRAIIRGKYIPTGWSVRSLDTTTKDKQKLLLRIAGKIKPGDIILLHDSMEITADILPELIETIQNKGYRIAPLDEMLHIKTYA